MTDDLEPAVLVKMTGNGHSAIVLAALRPAEVEQYLTWNISVSPRWNTFAPERGLMLSFTNAVFSCLVTLAPPMHQPLVSAFIDGNADSGETLRRMFKIVSPAGIVVSRCVFGHIAPGDRDSFTPVDGIVHFAKPTVK